MYLWKRCSLKMAVPELGHLVRDSLALPLCVHRVLLSWIPLNLCLHHGAGQNGSSRTAVLRTDAISQMVFNRELCELRKEKINSTQYSTV